MLHASFQPSGELTLLASGVRVEQADAQHNHDQLSITSSTMLMSSTMGLEDATIPPVS